MMDNAIFGDLLEEVAEKNIVTVVKYENYMSNGRLKMQEVIRDEATKTVCMVPGLARQDRYRMLAGKKPIYLDEAFRRVGGDLRSVASNLRTNVGIDFVARQLANAGASADANAADWIALSNNTTAPSATHTAATIPWSSSQTSDAAAGGTTGEFSNFAGGGRKVATQAHSGSATSYTLTATWTATGAMTALQVAGNFGGSTKGTAQGSATTNILFLETAFTSTTLANGDSLQLTWTVNI